MAEREDGIKVSVERERERHRSSPGRRDRRRLRRAAHATRLLSRSDDVKVTLIDRRQPPPVPAAPLPGGDRHPLPRPDLPRPAAHAAQAPNVRVVLSTVTAFDLERRVVHTQSVPGRFDEYPYDSLIVAAGAGQSYFGHDEFALIAPGMKTIDDAMELRRRVYGALELAETMPDAALAAVLDHLRRGRGGADRRRALRADPRAGGAQPPPRLPDHRPDLRAVVLVDGGSEPLANFGDRLSGAPARPREDGGRAAHGAAGRRRRSVRGRRPGAAGEKSASSAGR